MEIKYAATKDDYLKCWDVVFELRPNLTKEQFLNWMPEMEKQGYRLIFIEENGRAVSFCGFRRELLFYRGPSIYIDDLCTLPEARGKGHAGLLLDHVFALAEKEGLKSVHLDSGHQRHHAHRLYLNKKFRISAHHFEMLLK